MKRIFRFFKSKVVFLSMFVTDIGSRIDLKLPNNWYNMFNILKVWMGTFNSYLYGVDENARKEYDRMDFRIKDSKEDSFNQVMELKQDNNF